MRYVSKILTADQLINVPPKVIRKFKNGDFNVLVSTSIGEEGLDIGEVDMIVCYDAQKAPIRMVSGFFNAKGCRVNSLLYSFNVWVEQAANVMALCTYFSRQGGRNGTGIRPWMPTKQYKHSL